MDVLLLFRRSMVDMTMMMNVDVSLYNREVPHGNDDDEVLYV